MHGSSDSGSAVLGEITNPDNPSSATVGVHEGDGRAVAGYAIGGVGVYGHSDHSYGVEGETNHDVSWEAAGVRGHSVYTSTFGVLGQSEWGIGVEGGIHNPDNTSPAVVGFNNGGGDGVGGYSFNDVGVRGTTESAASYGGHFSNTGLGGAGVYAAGADNDSADLVLGGEPGADDGIIASAPDQPSSDIILVGNDAVAVVLDSNDDEDGHFTVWNGTEDQVFLVDEAGNVEITGDLTVAGYVNTRGPTSVRHDVTAAGVSVIDVPDYCIDGMCSVFIWSDATMGAFGPGMLWPVYYMQDSADDSWIGGPNLALGGVGHSNGWGDNGDPYYEYVHMGGETTGGGYARVLDDSAVEHSPYLWTISFNPVPGELTQATIIICPYGSPMAP